MMIENRYYVIDRRTMNALAGVEHRPFAQNRALARALKIRSDDLSWLPNDDEALIRFAVKEGLGFLQAADRHNINADAGAGWMALTAGDNKARPPVLGVHVEDLNRFQLEYVRALAERENVAIHLPRFAAESGATL